MNIQTVIQDYNKLADSLHMGYNQHIHGEHDIAGLRKAASIGRMFADNGLFDRTAEAWLIRALRMNERLESNPEE